MNRAEASRVRNGPFSEMALIHAAFLLTGVVTTMLGPLLPELSGRWNLSDAEAGSLFAFQSAGSLLGIGFSTWATPRIGFLNLLALGSILLAAGSAGLSVGPVQIGVGSILVYGVGLGISIPATNVLTAELRPGRRAAALNILNSAWCLGAFVGPSLIAVALERNSLRLFLLVLATSLLLAAGGYWRHARGDSGRLGRNPRSAAKAPFETDWSSIWLFGVLLFLYVGVETATWGWIATYARRLESAEAIWPLLQSAFWLAILLGRLATPILLRWLAPGKLVLGSLFLVLAGTVELIVVTEASHLLIGAALAGAGMACVYPTTVALFAASGGSQNSRSSGLVFALAILGGAVVPWLVGILSDSLGSLRTAMMAPTVCAAAMIVLQFRLMGRLEPGTDRVE